MASPTPAVALRTLFPALAEPAPATLASIAERSPGRERTHIKDRAALAAVAAA